MRSGRSRSGADRTVAVEMQDNSEERKDDGEEAADRLMSQVSAKSLDEAAADEQRQERLRLKEKEETKKELAKMLMKTGSGNYF